MEHIAIDLGARESQICIRGENGAILDETRLPTRRLGKFLQRRPTSRVIVETCAEAFSIADKALELGHEVRVVPGTLVRSLGVGARGIKTDRRDARVLSEVSCRIDLPSVHIPSQRMRKRKELCTMRESLLRARTLLVNSTRGWLRTKGCRLAKGTVPTFPYRVRTAYSELPDHVERMLATIEHMSEQVKALDAELVQLAQSDEVCKRLMTVPGVGPVTAVRFAAAIDDPSRFKNAHQVESYLGLVPGERQSSDRRHRTGITKAGSAAVRRTLVQAAWAARRAAREHPMAQWADEVERRRGKQIATVALARKMAGILFALMRDGTRYDPKRTTAPPRRSAT